MKLEIKLFANLQKYMPSAEKVELDDNCKVIDLLKKSVSIPLMQPSFLSMVDM